MCKINTILLIDIRNKLLLHQESSISRTIILKITWNMITLSLNKKNLI